MILCKDISWYLLSVSPYIALSVYSLLCLVQLKVSHMQYLGLVIMFCSSVFTGNTDLSNMFFFKTYSVWFWAWHLWSMVTTVCGVTEEWLLLLTLSGAGYRALAVYVCDKRLNLAVVPSYTFCTGPVCQENQICCCAGAHITDGRERGRCEQPMMHWLLFMALTSLYFLLLSFHWPLKLPDPLSLRPTDII